MKIVFLSLMFSDSSLKSAYRDSKCGVQIATHSFQDKLIGGLRMMGNVMNCNIRPIGSFPIHYKTAIMKSGKWSNNSYEVGFVNIPVVKHIIQRRAVIKWLAEVVDDDTWVMVYSLYEPYLKALNTLSKKKKIHCCLIQTDAIPGRNGMKKYMTRRSVKEGNRLVSMAKLFDSFVVLTSNLAEPLEIENRPYIVMECLCNGNESISERNNQRRKTFLYTGAIDKAYSIEDLLKAFSQIPQANLWICGTGDAKDLVEEYSNRFDNISYFGFVNHDTVTQMRAECSFLINPRRPDGTYTMYSFPSKTAEYMVSGKPTVMYKLEGIPDEYDQYLNYMYSTEIEGMIREIECIVDSDYDALCEKALLGRQYMLENKTSEIQAKRIWNFLEKIYRG